MNHSYNARTPSYSPLRRVQFIAPYWADVDLKGFGQVYYRQTKDTVLLARATNEIQRHFPLSQNVIVTNLLIVTWDAVGYYNRHNDKVGSCNFTHIVMCSHFTYVQQGARKSMFHNHNYANLL